MFGDIMRMIPTSSRIQDTNSSLGLRVDSRATPRSNVNSPTWAYQTTIRIIKLQVMIIKK